MKKHTLRTTAALLAAAVTLSLAPTAGASQALGTEIHTVTQTLGEGVELTRQYLWSATYSDLRTEHYLTYTPSEDVSPALVYGSKITGKQTLSAMAQTLEAEGLRVLGGMNGDYYVVATGTPLGMVVTDGVLRSTPQYTDSWSLGFLADGTAFIAQPTLSVTVSFAGQTLAVSGGINKVRQAQGGYYLLTDEFADTTMNTSPGIDVILRPLDEDLGSTVEIALPAAEETDTEEAQRADSESLTAEDVVPEAVSAEDVTVTRTGQSITLTRSDTLKVNSRVTCQVVDVLRSEGKIAIPAGCFVLTINEQADAWLRAQLLTLTAGDRVDIDVFSPDERWQQAVTAVGGMYKLVTEGTVESGLSSEQAPRSAVGVRADGSAVFYTVDGRQAGYSVGASLTQVAQRLVELGCVEAVCMDGGGSTTLGVTQPDATALEIVNRPSDGTQRANSNALFLVSTRQATGKADHFTITPYDNLILAGSDLQLSAHLVDTAGFPMEGQSSSLRWSVSEGEGSITQDGLFTAGENSGPVTVSVTDGRRTGSVSIQVVRTPHSLHLVREDTGAALTSLHLEPGEELDLTAKAVWWNLDVSGGDETLIWTADPSVGTVDETGHFTAADHNGEGYLTLSAGEKSLSVPVRISGHILPLEDFESGTGNWLSTDTAQLEQNTDLDRVRFGRASARVSYQTGWSSAIFGATLPIPAGESVLSLWVYGDGSGNALTAAFTDSSGERLESALTTLDFTGWKQVKGAIPTGSTALQSISITCTGTAESGTIWLDQLTTSNGQDTDNEAPLIELNLENGIVQAVISDAFDGAVDPARISVALDGQSLDFAWDAASSRLTLALPQDTGRTHRVSITACDISGNLARASLSCPADGEEVPFLDMAGHWAESDAAYLYQHGVTQGVRSEDGFVFLPDQAITRGEFALMLTRWMGLDVASYADVTLPFADAASIPDWMLPAVRAMYAEGIMKGSQINGVLSACATQSISRAECMVLLGRTLSKGYPTAALTFDDAGQVPDWALEHVQLLTGLGVVNGYNNCVSPSAQVTRASVAKMLVSLT